MDCTPETRGAEGRCLGAMIYFMRYKVMISFSIGFMINMLFVAACTHTCTHTNTHLHTCAHTPTHTDAHTQHKLEPTSPDDYTIIHLQTQPLETLMVAVWIEMGWGRGIWVCE